MSDLTTREIRLLAPYLRALEQLDRGERKPKTFLQSQFISVCRGTSPARTKYEKAYLKWRKNKHDSVEQKKIEARRAQQWSRTKRERELLRQAELMKIELQAKRREVLDLARQKTQGAKSRPRIIEQWGTREDWKRDRASWRRKPSD